MRIYNTLSRTKETFVTRESGKVFMYVCGPTVYNLIHIGNARTFLSFDTVRRYLEWRGFEVVFVQNVTDVDDKIINRANQEGRSAAEVAQEYTQAFIDDMRAMGVQDPTYRPLATETIPEMIGMIERLVEKGHAYAVDGDVYFSVRSFPAYGKLSGRDVDDMRSGARINVDERKQDPLDFAVWKAAKPGEPSWSSPWGPGRPGWHIECSAMSEKELGLPFDIHGGGVDLVFPHHENEIAQSEAATGVDFARYWMHGGMLQINAEKMSKSLGNFLLLRDALQSHRPQVIRFLMLQTHYRSPLDFSDARLAESAVALERIESFIRNCAWFAGAAGGTAAGEPDTELTAAVGAAVDAAREKYVAEMDDDFNTAGALAAVYELMPAVNGVVAQAGTQNVSPQLRAAVGAAGEFVRELVEVLGVDLSHGDQIAEGYPAGVRDLAAELAGYAGDDVTEAMDVLLELRASARTEKNWGLADAIRDGLAAYGVTVEDTAQGPRVVVTT